MANEILAHEDNQELTSSEEQIIYKFLKNAIAKSLIDKESFNSEEINESIDSVCQELLNNKVDEELAHLVLKKLLASLIASEMEGMFGQYFFDESNKQISHLNFSHLCFSQKLSRRNK